MKYVTISMIAAAVIGLSALVPYASADKRDDNLRTLNATLLDQYVVARHHALDQATERLSSTLSRFCAVPSVAGLQKSQAAFGGVVVAWAGAQHLNFEPQSVGMRSFRMQFWPDPKNRTGRRIAQYLRDRDKALLEPDRFLKASVTIQGLPALERVLFDKDSVDALVADAEEGTDRCELARAIAENVYSIGSGLQDDWVRQDGFRTEILRPTENGFFQSDAEVTNTFYSKFHDAIDLALELKLARPLGASIEKARPRNAEYWRSRNSLRSIEANLRASNAMWSATDYGFRKLAQDRNVPDALITITDNAFAEAFENLGALDSSLSEAVADSSEREKLERFRTSLSGLRAVVRGELAKALGVVIGFNSRDGD